MADTSRTVRVRFDGAVDGLVRAARTADKELSNLTKHEKGINKAFGALGTASKGLLALGSASNAVQGVAALGGAVGTATGALLLLPAAAAAGGLAFGALKLASAGVSDALAGNVEALDELQPSARATVKAVHDLAPAWSKLQGELQQELFTDLAAPVKELGTKLIPILGERFDRVAIAANGAAKNVLLMLGAPSRLEDIKTIANGGATAFENLAGAVGPLGAALIDVTAVGSKFLDGLTYGADEAAKSFQRWISEMRKSGELERIMSRGLDAIGKIGSTVGSVGRSVGLIFKGLASGGGDVLDSVLKTAKAVEDFLRSVEGQDTLKALGETMRVVGDVARNVLMTALREFGPVIKELAPAAQEFARGLGDFLVGAIETVGPMLQGLAQFLSANKDEIRELTPFIAGVVVALKGLQIASSVSGWVSGALSSLDMLGKKADDTATKVGKDGGKGGKGGGLKGALRGIGIGVGVAGALVALDSIGTSADGAKARVTGLQDSLRAFAVAAGSLDVGFFFDEIVAEIEYGKVVWHQFQNLITGFKPTPINFEADTAPAERTVGNLIREINGHSPEVNINGNTNGAGFALRTILDEIAAGHEFVTIDGKQVPAQQALADVKRLIDSSIGTVTVNGRTVPASEALADILARTNRSNASINVGANTGPANAAIGGLVRNWDGRGINLYVTTHGTGGIASAGRYATGGPVSGPGTGTSDTAGLFALSNGEHVLTAREVRNAGGHDAIMRMRAQLASGKFRGLAGGGPVKWGDVSEKRWNELRAQGWLGRSNDGMEALYSPDQPVKWGSITEAKWNELRAQGWKGRAEDGMEALYAPSGMAQSALRGTQSALSRSRTAGNGKGVVVTFNGNTTDALATLIMRMIRENRIQIKAA